MKLLLVNTIDRGGAANSCLRLHQGLLHQHVQSSVLLKQNSKNLAHTLTLRQGPKTLSRKVRAINKIKRVLKEFHLTSHSKTEVNQFLKTRSKHLEMFSYPNSGLDITTSEHYKRADLINLHWVANFLDYSSFFKKNTKPIIWTLHDMNPFTGGEHYLEEYLGIDEKGFPIKRTYTKEEIAEAQKNLEIKKEALKDVRNLTIVAPSKWLAEEAKNSKLFANYSVHHIPYGLDENIFKPMNKDYSRSVLGIPSNKKVILFVADSISNSRKGFEYLYKAFKKLNDQDLVLCAIGKKNEALKSLDNIFELGPIYDERLMSIAYSAADVFVIPSLMDNLPNTVLESLMCGTPVIGFPIGGIPDMIQDGQNGYLTQEISVDALKNSIDKFLMNSENFNNDKIRSNAVQKYALEVQARAYKELFENILKK